ncbi:MAG: DMT family transporter [Chloroflexi bacterium]|nr:DMT family transporter [Chloroflexota bacterium]
MHDLPGLLLGLTAALAWGVTDTAATVASRRVGSLRATAGTQLVSVVVLVVLVVATGTRLPPAPDVVLTALACGTVSAVAYLAFYTALRHGPITVVSPVVSTYGGLTVALSVLLLGESLDPLQAFGVGVATAGIVLAAIAFEAGLRSARPVGPGVAYAFAALVAFAVLTVALAGPIRSAGWLPVLLFARVANASTVSVILGVSRARRPVEPAAAGRRVDGRTVALVALAGLLDIGGFIAFAIGLEIAPTWLIGLTSSFGPVIAVGAGVILFAERPRPVQWLGLGLVAASVFLIALG